MTNAMISTSAGSASRAESTDECERPEYEAPETVRVGAIAEVTRGSGPASLDGPYGPGWQKYDA